MFGASAESMAQVSRGNGYLMSLWDLYGDIPGFLLGPRIPYPVDDNRALHGQKKCCRTLNPNPKP